MLVPPLVISRPGENHTPSTGCEITGSTLPGDGPYVCYLGKNYSKQAIKELAEPVGLLIEEKAQAEFEKLFARLIEAETTIRNRADETRAVKAALEAAEAELATVRSERDAALDQLAKAETAADVTRKAIATIFKPKKETARV